MEDHTSNFFFIEIFYPELVADVRAAFKEHIFPHADPKDKPGASLRYLIIDNRYEYKFLNLLLVKYVFLSEHLFIFRLRPNQETNIHTDGIVHDAKMTPNLRGWKRQYSLNLPIKNCTSQCKTEFFNIENHAMFVDQPSNTTWLKDGEPAEKIAEYCLLNNPILMNPQVPHRIINSSHDMYRTSVSWTIKPDWTWEKLQTHFFDRQQNLV